MKKFIINILLFFAIVTVIDLCVSFIGDYFQAHARGGISKEFNDLVRNDRHDILILGSSRAHHHYDTPFLSDTLGMDVYNAGYDGNGIVLAYGIAEMILKRYKPKMIIYDVEPTFDIYEYSGDNNHKRYIANLKPYYRILEIGSIIEDVSKEEWYKVHSGMMCYNTSIITLAIDNYKGGKDYAGGFIPLTGAMTKDPEISNNDTMIYDQFKIDYIEKLVLLAVSKDIPIAIVASPKYGKINSDECNAIKTICKKYGAPFWDYYADPLFMSHKEWFKEPMHLNEVGARVFSDTIACEIMKCL